MAAPTAIHGNTHKAQALKPVWVPTFVGMTMLSDEWPT
jgi:hypothetical protein